MSQALSAGKTVRAEEVVLKAPDGRSISALMNATSIPSDDDGVENLIVTLQDMTEMEEIERLRAEFLAMVSHELRTPLATVRGSVSALLDEFSEMHPAEVRQFHRIIFEQTDRMRALIADLLDVARIATGTLSIAPGPTDVAVLTAEAGNAFRIGGHGHSLRIDVPPDLPWVMADRSRIVQVLGNLLTNAARHSPESSTIGVSAAPGDLQVSVSVSDDGRGIPAESMPHLFRKFSRLESEEQGGDTGLGLAVCKGIIEAHGGRIWAESDGPGLGATFTFTLPTVEEAGFVSPAAPPQLSTRPSRRSVREQVRILAVDDDLQALRYIRDALVKAGYAVVATSDPEDTLRLMEEERPHLVLLDLMLPGVDGIDLMKDIVAARDLPVIFVSAYGQDRLVARAFEMGADDYVVKPFSPTELVARIKAALRRRTLSEPAVPYVRGRPDHRLRRTPGDACRQADSFDCHPVPPARRAIRERGTGADLRTPAEAGLGHGWRRRRAAHAHLRQRHPPQAGRRRRQPDLHLHRASCGLPDAHGRVAGQPEGDLRKHRSRCIVPTRHRTRATQDFGVALRDCWRRQPALLQRAVGTQKLPTRMSCGTRRRFWSGGAGRFSSFACSFCSTAPNSSSSNTWLTRFSLHCWQG